MNNLLSTVSGYFSRALILGAFLPAVIFVTLFLLFVAPNISAEMQFMQQLRNLDPEWKVFSSIFATVVLSGLLFNLNIPHVRLYEGYPWRETLIGEWMICLRIRRFR